MRVMSGLLLATDDELAERADGGDLPGAHERGRQPLADDRGTGHGGGGRQLRAGVLPRLQRLVAVVTQLDRPVRAWRLLGRARFVGDVLDLVGLDDELDAVRHALHGDREDVAVAPGVLLVERLDHALDRLAGDGAVGDADERRLPALAVEAPVEAAPNGVLPLRRR